MLTVKKEFKKILVEAHQPERGNNTVLEMSWSVFHPSKICRRHYSVFLSFFPFLRNIRSKQLHNDDDH